MNYAKEIRELKARVEKLENPEKHENLENHGKITLEEFWNSDEQLGIYCKTKEQAEKLCKAFDNMGKRWISGERYSKRQDLIYAEYCYINDGTWGDDRKELEENNYKIYNFEDVIFPEEPKHEFKVGDRVQFKTWEEMENEFRVDKYGNIKKILFTKYMKHLCGTLATISEIDENNHVELTDFTAKGQICWNYYLGMLKPVEEPKWSFTEDEKIILKNVDKEFKWIARDRNGDLYFYETKPKKYIADWCDSIANHINFFNHIFQCIKWEDDEPCEFRRYL